MSTLYNRNFILTIISQMFLVTGTSMINHYARWITFLGGNETHVGYIMGIGPISGFLMRPWIGPWVDRIGSRASQIIGCVLIVLGILGNLAFYDLSIGLYFLRSGLVIGGAIFFAASATYVIQMSPPDRKTEAVGMLGCGGFVGMALGPLLGDWLLGDVATRTRGAFVWMFVLSALSASIAAMLVMCFRQSPQYEQRTKGRLIEFLSALRTYWPGSILVVNATFGVCMTVVLYFLSKFLDTIGAGSLGGFFTVYCSWAIFVRLATRTLPDRMGKRRVVTVGMLFWAVGMLILNFVTKENISLLYVAALFTGTGHALTFHTMFAVTTEPFPPHLQGTASSVTLTCLDFGTIVSSPIIGNLAHDFGYNVVFKSVSALCLAVGLYFGFDSLASHRRQIEARRTAG